VAAPASARKDEFHFPDSTAGSVPHTAAVFLSRFYFFSANEVGKHYPAILSVEIASEDHIEFLEFGFFSRYAVHYAEPIAWDHY